MANDDAIEPTAYAEFREGLLRHIGMEEKILLPAAARAGRPHPLAARLRQDHGALAALLVPPPSKRIVGAIRMVLEAHNPVEEGPGGVYAQCEEWIGSAADEILDRLKRAPAVAVAPYVDKASAIEFAWQALQRADYSVPEST